MVNVTRFCLRLPWMLWLSFVPHPIITPLLRRVTKVCISCLVGKQIGRTLFVKFTGLDNCNIAMFDDKRFKSALKWLFMTTFLTLSNSGFGLPFPLSCAPSSILINCGCILKGPRWTQCDVVRTHCLSIRVPIQPSMSPNDSKWSKTAQGQLSGTASCHPWPVGCWALRATPQPTDKQKYQLRLQTISHAQERRFWERKQIGN